MGNRLCLFLYGSSSVLTSLGEFHYFDSTMWIQDRGETLFLFATSPAVRSKNRGKFVLVFRLTRWPARYRIQSEIKCGSVISINI
jgi:hypothetical protein